MLEERTAVVMGRRWWGRRKQWQGGEGKVAEWEVGQRKCGGGVDNDYSEGKRW